jgi:hypothetical protein
MKIYIAKPDTWFKEGTEVNLVEDYRQDNFPDIGLFQGIFVIDDEKWLNVKQQWRTHEVGDEVIDREVCNFDEFDEKEV